MVNLSMHDLYLGLDSKDSYFTEAGEDIPEDEEGVNIGTADSEDNPAESDEDVPTDTGKGTEANAAATERVEQEKALSENPELDSLKKFLLIQKLQDLNTNLMKHDILNDSLSTFLEFCGSLSYDTILSISSGFTDYIAANLKTLNSEEKTT